MRRISSQHFLVYKKSFHSIKRETLKSPLNLTKSLLSTSHCFINIPTNFDCAPLNSIKNDFSSFQHQISWIFLTNKVYHKSCVALSSVKPNFRCRAELEFLVAFSCDKGLDRSDRPSSKCRCCHRSTRNVSDHFQTSSHKDPTRALRTCERLFEHRFHPRVEIQRARPV